MVGSRRLQRLGYGVSVNKKRDKGVMTTLYATIAGVSLESGIPTFCEHVGYWTIGSRNYTPMEMVTRAMYLVNPARTV